MAKNKYRETIAYIEGCDGELNGPNRRPFFKIRLEKGQAEHLLQHLEKCSECDNRQWFTLTATHDKPTRLRLTKELRVPDYETAAASIYLRGEIARISGDNGSCNITFSGAVGGLLLAQRLRSAWQRMRTFLDIRITSRKRNLLEMIPDTELEAAESTEHQRLAEMGASVAAETWPNEDFSDWEVVDG